VAPRRVPQQVQGGQPVAPGGLVLRHAGHHLLRRLQHPQVLRSEVRVCPGQKKFKQLFLFVTVTKRLIMVCHERD
jgi:hypothetical protein